MAGSTTRGVRQTRGATPPEWGRARTVADAPSRLWLWPYGLVVPALLLVWYLLPVGWLWVVLAFVAGLLVSLRTWSRVGRHGFGSDATAARGGAR